MTMWIRRAEAEDATALAEIYNHYVRETPITFDTEEKSVADRAEWLAHFSAAGRYQCFVAVADRQVIGWASSHRFRDRAAYDTTVETSIYLAPDRRGLGLGRRLYSTLFDALQGQDLHRAYGGVTQPNDASNRLHAAMGFRQVGLLAEIGRKFGRYWDVAIWVRAVS
ncbi:MAG TPA: GNAT family N-acetyltransferase [Rhizomicrobium sp.]|nr:GNAT family N-acetyltransferase [Rhizomicrobium sp.]